MSGPPPKPFPDARILAAAEAAPAGTRVWLYEGTLERFAGGSGRFPFSQRIAWQADAEWESVRKLGLWMVERLSVNGHLLVGLRARPEDEPEAESRLILPEED